jgi:hypothetical protein
MAEGSKFDRKSDGGFKVLAKYGAAVPTRKSSETVQVQLVQVGGDTGKKWLEARLQYLNANGKWTSTKTALSFDKIEDIEVLVATLETAADYLRAEGHLPAPDAAVQDEVEDDAPVIPLKARAAAFNDDALVPEDD